MQNFECAFYVVTGIKTWGRHLELNEAFKAAGIKPGEKKVNYIMTVLLFKQDTPRDIMNNVLHCYFVNDWGSINQCTGLSEEDKSQVQEFLIGFTSYDNQSELKALKAKAEKAES